MRIQVVRDVEARSAGRHRLAHALANTGTNALAKALAGGRRATTGALAAAACGLAVTACASYGSPGAAPSASRTEAAVNAMGSPAPASIDACVTSQLKVSISRTGAIAGQAGGYLRFTNGGRTPCRMTGWPVVTGLTAAGTATPLRHAQSTMFGAWRYSAPPPVVTLQPGDSAYSVVVADDQAAGSSAHCPAPYVRLRVSPPGDSGDVIIAAWLPGAGSYLPACKSLSGSPTAETSTITTLAQLAH